MDNAANPILRLYNGFVRAASSLPSPFLLVIRAYWGWQISQNGWAKLHNLPHVTQFFASLGLPAPAFTAAFVSGFEFTAGILLAVGLLSRIAALGLVIDMTMAYLLGDRDSFLAFFSNPGKFYGADPFIFLFVGLIILIFGPGKLSLDTLLKRMMGKGKYLDSAETSSSAA
jgi:putative oxidoreductase